MVKIVKELQDFIDKNSKNYNIELEVKGWQETGKYCGEKPEPIFTIKLTEKVLR
jgi:hypothetical protein